MLQSAAHFLHSSLRRGRPVLLHGPSRTEADERDGSEDAGVVLAAFLVQCYGWNPMDASVGICTRRPNAELLEMDSRLIGKLDRVQSQATCSVSAQGTEDVGVSQAVELSPPAASEVVSGLLWLGGADAATVAGIRQFKFGFVLNVTETLPFVDVPGVQKLRVPLSQIPSSGDLVVQWPRVLQFLERARKEQQRVLVHGSLGRSRAAAVVVGYIMQSQGLSFPAALREVRRYRPMAHPTSSLAADLQSYQSIMESASSDSDVAAPMAIEDGAALAALDAEAFEAAVAQLGELLPVPIDLRREVLARHSGNIERAASELLAWLDGEERPVKRVAEIGASSASSSACAAAPSSSSTACKWAALAGGIDASRRGADSSSARERASSEDGTAASEPRQREVSGVQLAQCYVEGREQIPECVICGRNSQRGGSAPVVHADLGWVHRVCLDQAGWT